MKRFSRLQTTQPTNGGAVTAAINCCANCVEPSRPQQCGPDIPFLASRPCGWLALLLTKVGDVETNAGPITQANKSVFAISAINKYMLASKQISIMCNRIEHWVHLRSSGIRHAQYTDTRTCHLHR